MKNNEKKKSKGIWCATYVVRSIEQGEINSFGNLFGFVYNDEETAWNAILQDLEGLGGGGRDGNTVIDRGHNRVVFTDKADMLEYTWELQRMFPNNGKAKIPH